MVNGIVHNQHIVQVRIEAPLKRAMTMFFLMKLVQQTEYQRLTNIY